MAEITQLLSAACHGDASSYDALFSRLYPELRQLARAQMGASEATLTPTVLVHEVYERMLGRLPVDLGERRQFFGCAARVMRSIAVDSARHRRAAKRGGGVANVTLTERMAPKLEADDELLALDEALTLLRERQPQQAQVVELHYFAGFGFAEIAALQASSERTVKREWQRARAFLHAQLA
ncbi:MAG: ECF-type sigma factor [Xanthomonadales bacterium]|nr:ECF-type sigma factor [Xanthomonadales bacterium]